MAIHLQVDGQAGGGGGLAAGGGAGDQHNMLVLLVDLPGDLIDGGFMQGFVHPDEVAQLVLLNQDTDVADIGDAEDFAPVRALGEDLQVLRTIDIRCGMVEVGAGRQLQHEAAPQLKEGKHRDIAGGNGHGAVEVFPHAVDAVHGESGHGTAGKQFHLVLLFFFLKVADGVLPRPLLPGEDQVQLDDAAHLVLDADDILAVQLHARETDENAVADGIFDADLLVGKKMPQGQQHYKTEGALVDPAAFLMLQRQGRQRAVAAERIVQLNHDAAGQRGQRAARKSVQADKAVPDGGPFREFFLIVHGTDDHNMSSFG